MDLFTLKTLLLLLSLLGCCAETDVLPSGPVDAVLGSDVTIKTLLKNTTSSVLLWNYSDGKGQDNIITVMGGTVTVSQQYTGRADVNTTNGYLTLKGLKPEDSGDYSLSLIRGGVTKTGEIKLRVLEPVSAVAIKSDLPAAVEHKSTVVLTCSAKGSFLKFTWLNGTAPIVADGNRLTVKEEEFSSALTIRDVRRTDLVGPIYCKAANPLEFKMSAPFNLTVHYGPDPAMISPAMPPKYIKSKSNFSLTCAAHSSPPATFTWFHNKDQMKVTGPVLTLKDIEAGGYGENVDEYTCKANNKETELTAVSPPVSFAVIEAISGITITGPTGVLIAGNSSANISCQAKMGSVKTKTWLKDGKPLEPSPNRVFAADRSSVMFKVLQKEDNGKYTCQFSNPVNTDEASYNMVVNFGPDSAIVTGENLVEVDAPVTLTCSAMSVPPPSFTWKFNGTATNVKTGKYTIEKVMYKNSGTYTCEARNPLTNKTSTYTHIVTVLEEVPEGLSDGAIAGIVIGVLAALAAAVGLIFYCRQKVPVESPY